MTNQNSLTKVFFKVFTEGGESTTESMWAERVGDEYRLDNTPFFTYGIATDDIFSVKEEDGAVFFRNIVHRSGHSNYRIFLNDSLESKEARTVLEQIRDLGCSYEGNGNHLLSIDVPPSVNRADLLNFLEKGEGKTWEYEVGYSFEE